jgi:DNA-binding NtrC family response regulator
LDDLPFLAATLIERLNQKHGTKVVDLDPSALAQLKSRPWEGNIREFRNALERAVILAGEGTLGPEHFRMTHRAPPRPANDSGLDIGVGITIDDAEQALIRATLLHTGNNKTRAAGILGISARTLHAKLKQYSLESEEDSISVE